MHSFMGVPVLSTHRLAKLEVCRALFLIFSLCLYHGMAPERFISPRWTHFRLTRTCWQMSDCGVFKKAVSALCVKIDDELMGRNKINTRHRFLKGNTNSGIPEKFSFGIQESWDLESRIQLKESRIPNPEPKLHWLLKNPESEAWNLESKNVLDYLTLARPTTTSNTAF